MSKKISDEQGYQEYASYVDDLRNVMYSYVQKLSDEDISKKGIKKTLKIGYKQALEYEL